MKVMIKSILTFLVSTIGYFLGGFDTMLNTLLVFMVIDYFSGVIVAIKNKKVCSKIGFIGIFRKLVILLLVGACNLLGIAIGLEELRYVAIAFYLANEGISIVENAGKLGIPIPNKLKEILSQLKDGE
jgi:toxin secretion/phage lysis holin